MSEVNLDTKGRLTLPTRYREVILEMDQGQMVLTIDAVENCLLLYPAGVWGEIERKLEALPSFNAAARRIQRLFIGHATDLALDATGRILVSAHLRQYANLEKRAVLVGQGKKFEIWNEADWHHKREEWLGDQEVQDQLPEDLMRFSL